MEQSLAYVREILAAHTENQELGNRIYNKITKHHYSNELEFIRKLTTEESNYLNQILREAIDYSKQEQDSERVRQLNDVYELLFV